ncbi:MAG TPA: acetyl-CoA C-acetyltransferase [Planctomycetota bacterium]|nr:acetyl-CoA C-acetyltransferase [Planctomycetota bacterium]
MTSVVVTHAVRTPVGKFLGQFGETAATDLGVAALKGLLARSGVAAADVDLSVWGCARQAALGPNPGRQVAVKGGIPVEKPAWTLNMACGSGLWALVQAAQNIQSGEADVVVAGGFENMTRVPFLLPQLRKGYRLGHAPVVDAMYQDGFLCPMAGQLMGETAETLARRYGISREEQDAYGALSQNRFEAARRRGAWADEVVPVTLAQKGGAVETTTDEHPRDGVVPADLAKLAPVFSKEGTVTAGNASGIADGAAALLLMSEATARKRGLKPLATFEGRAAAGVDPKVMGLGPVPSTAALMKRLGRKIDQYDLVELNEAFAAQVLACDREMKLDRARLNVNGGSIAIGHPIGCSGARIVVTLLHEMKRRGAKLGLATLCISGGQGIAASFAAPH